MTTSSPASTARSVTRAGRAATALGAVVAAVLIWIVAVPLAGAELAVSRSGRTSEVGVVMVVANALGAALAGWALLAILEHRLRERGLKIWTVVAGVVLVLSLVPPLTVDASTGTRLTLASMHVVVGAILIVGLRRTVRS